MKDEYYKKISKTNWELVLTHQEKAFSLMNKWDNFEFWAEVHEKWKKYYNKKKKEKKWN